MNLSTSSSNFRLFRPIFRPVIIFVFLVTLYQTLVTGGVLSPSDGLNQWQTNLIKAERYVYDNKSNIKLAIVGSSIASRIRADYIGSDVANLAMSAFSSQTGLEIVTKKNLKPNVVAIETNRTIQIPVDAKTIDYLYNPIFYFFRSYFPILRQEYQPVSVFIDSVKNLRKQKKNEDAEEIDNPKLREYLITEVIQQKMKPISEIIENKIRVEAEKIKTKIAELQKDGVRVVLFDVPGEERIEQTLQEQQLAEIIAQLFPKNTFEWIPKPASKDWATSDGIHLIDKYAKRYADFLAQQIWRLAI